MNPGDFARPEVLAAFLSAVATGFAAFATWKAPVVAARMAEALRQAAQATDDRRRLKMQVFVTLMQHRVRFEELEGVRALNTIDVAFVDNRPVRDAWADVLNSYDMQRNVPPHAQAERIRRLLELMAADLGLANRLRPDDLDRVYKPRWLVEELEAQHLERQRRLEQLRPLAGAPSGPERRPPTEMWPPRPS